ncbi:MAG: mechanosensitive ion channel [Myxococcales bacterium]|nr:mechanosensitive ion channel [Myxococcales bacterium]
MDLLDSLRDNAVARDGLASLVLLLVALGMRSAALRTLARTSIDTQVQLRLRGQIRNATLVVIVLGVAVIWAHELRAVALSVAAVAAALAIVTKELLMCLIGSSMRISGGSFQVGDRIEVAGVRGDVLDIGPLTTTVLEVGPGLSIHQRTGRKITLPNSVFLTQAVTNETISDAYVLHVLRIPLATDGDWKAAERRLTSIAHDRCAQYVDEASRALARVSPAGVKGQLISAEPAVYLELPEPNKIELLLRFPAPARQRGRVAQQILRDFLEDPVDSDEDPRSPSLSHA